MKPIGPHKSSSEPAHLPDQAEQLNQMGNKMDRRTFIQKVMNGTIAGSLLLVFPLTADTFVPEEEIPGVRDEPYDIFNQHFAFVVDSTRCTG